MSFLVVACGLLLVVACSGGNQGESERRHIASNFTELVVAALEDPTLQEFDRDVLKRAQISGRIEQADYDEAFSRFAQCMKTSGKPVTLTRLSNGLYRVANTPLSDGESIESAIAIVTKCQQGTTNQIAELFGIQQGNPDLLANPYEIAHKCLNSKGLVDSSFSAEDLRKAIGSEGHGGESLHEKLPFDPEDDEAQACFVGANMTIAKAES